MGQRIKGIWLACRGERDKNLPAALSAERGWPYGVKRFVKLGTYGPTAPEEARDRAKAILGAVAAGSDPAGELIKARAA